LILFSRGRGPDSFHQIEELFVKSGAHLNVTYEFDFLLSVINFIAIGIGISLLPDHHQRIGVPGVVFRPLKPARFIKKLAITKLRAVPRRYSSALPAKHSRNRPARLTRLLKRD
jgi:DNA-binding transcriptional LysR family regulator